MVEVVYLWLHCTVLVDPSHVGRGMHMAYGGTVGVARFMERDITIWNGTECRCCTAGVEDRRHFNLSWLQNGTSRLKTS